MTIPNSGWSTLYTNKTAEHLMHLINTRNGNVPNFSLLLGSGTSVTSGVKTAQEMIKEWRTLLLNRSGRSEGDDVYQNQLVPDNHEDEYSILFEQVYDQPSQRRVYVEECLKGARPSWGYVYLTSLLSERVFDVVFTTNFDDLLNEACYLYSDDLRPIVGAHDSAIQGIRVTAGRPKIIKLHGDFLYDNIKNTIAELETLETNTKRKLSQFAKEYGLIVLGYSGRDRSVMDTLELLLKDDENYMQGVYWCIRPGDQISKRLESLLKRDRVYLVEIDGFDEFIADLHQTMKFALPKSVAQPLEMAKDRVRLIVNVGDPLKSHPVIDAHIKETLNNLRTRQPKIPLQVEAAILADLGDFDEAVIAWEQAYQEDPADLHIAYEYAQALADGGKYDELAEFASKSPLSVGDKTFFLLRAGHNQEVIDLATKNLSNTDTIQSNESSERAIIRINRAIALKRLGHTDELTADLNFLDRNGDTVDSNIKVGVAALRKDRKAMFDALKECLYKTLSPGQLFVFPVFEDYQDDPEFRDFVVNSSRSRKFDRPIEGPHEFDE